MKRLKTLSSLFFLTASVSAQDPLVMNIESPWYKYTADTGWHYDLGIGLEYEPTYAGSKNYNTEAAVLGRAIYKAESGNRYYVSLGEVGAMIPLSPNTQILAFLEYEDGRESADDDLLNGLNSIDATVEGQFTLAHRFGNKTLFATLQPDVAGDANKGLVWFVGGSYDWFSKNNKWRFSSRVDLSGADSEYMQTDFGVTAQESAASGYQTYTPDAGLKSLSFGFSSEYYISNKLSVLSSVEIENYLDKAADSPLIQDGGDKTGVEASVLLRWSL